MAFIRFHYFIIFLFLYSVTVFSKSTKIIKVRIRVKESISLVNLYKKMLKSPDLFDSQSKAFLFTKKKNKQHNLNALKKGEIVSLYFNKGHKRSGKRKTKTAKNKTKNVKTEEAPLTKNITVGLSLGRREGAFESRVVGAGARAFFVGYKYALNSSDYIQAQLSFHALADIKYSFTNSPDKTEASFPEFELTYAQKVSPGLKIGGRYALSYYFINVITTTISSIPDVRVDPVHEGLIYLSYQALDDLNIDLSAGYSFINFKGPSAEIGLKYRFLNKEDYDLILGLNGKLAKLSSSSIETTNKEVIFSLSADF